MHVNVPQFVDVEDKIAFGLTGKQLLWMGAMTAALVVTYSLFDQQSFYAVGAIIIIVFCALAFWKPQGIPLISFLGFVIMFFTKPRNYVWKRVFSTKHINVKKAHDVQRKKIGEHPKEKKLPSQGQLHKIAWMLDTKK